jgi:hypothetical protein
VHQIKFSADFARWDDTLSIPALLYVFPFFN